MAQLSDTQITLLIIFFIISLIILALFFVVYIKIRREQEREIAKTKEEIAELKKRADILISEIEKLQTK